MINKMHNVNKMNKKEKIIFPKNNSKLDNANKINNSKEMKKNKR